MNTALHGVPNIVNGNYQCACCGYESRILNDFATIMCWACVSGNIDCLNCFREGVPIDKVSDRRGRMHRLAGWDDDEHIQAVTCCGMHIFHGDIGQALSAKSQCKHCWR